MDIAHLFVSYSRANAETVGIVIDRLHGAGHSTWFDNHSIRVGDGWQRAIGRGIADCDMFLLFLSKDSLSSEWVKREVLMAAKAHKPILPVALDATEKKSDVFGLRDIQSIRLYPDCDAGIARLLKDVGPGSGSGGRIPFLVDHPRLRGFLGRDTEFLNLHETLMTAGETGTPPTGISGMGGIGKTQFAVEYAHRYRYHYPDGVFMLNAAATNWTAEFAALAHRMGTSKRSHDSLLDAADEFVRHITDNREALVILDNVGDVIDFNRRPIGRGAVAGNLACRVLFTTRQRVGIDEFNALNIDMLPVEDARKLLTSKRPDIDPEDAAVAQVCEALGRLPLALSLAAAFLKRKPAATPAAYLKHLRRYGLDATHAKAHLRKVALPAYANLSVGPALRAQWKLLELDHTSDLLDVVAAHPENAHVPIARIGLMSGLRDAADGIDTPIRDALQEAIDANLLEGLGGASVRLHPVVRDFVRHRRKRNWQKVGAAARDQLTRSYEDPSELDANYRLRGIDEVIGDLSNALTLGEASSNSRNAARTQTVLTILQQEQHVLRDRQSGTQASFLPQQIAKRAQELGQSGLAERAQVLVETLAQPYLSQVWKTGVSPMLNLVHDRPTVTDCAFHGDARFLLTVGHQGILQEWDANTGEPIRASSFGSEGADGIAVCDACGLAVLGVSRGDPVLWDIPTWSKVRTLKGNGYAGWAVAISEDGKLALTACDGGVALWDVSTGHRLAKLRNKATINVISFLGKSRAVTGDDAGEVTLWDIEKRRKLRKLGLHPNAAAWSVAASPDGRFVAAGFDDGLIAVWNMETGQDPDWIEGHTSIVRSLAFDPSGHHLWSGSGDGSLRRWTLEGKTRPVTVQAHNGYIRGLDISHDGRRIASAADDCSARVWDAGQIGSSRAPAAHGAEITGLAVSSDGQTVVSTSWNAQVHVREASSGRLVRQWSDAYDDGLQIRSSAVFPDGSRLILGCDQDLKSWPLNTAEPEDMGHIEFADSIALSGDNRLAICGSWPRVLTLWDLDQNKRVRTLLRGSSPMKPNLRTIAAVALSVDGRFAFAAADAKGLLVWDLHKRGGAVSGRTDQSFGHLAILSDGKHLVASAGGDRCELVAIPSCQTVRSFKTGATSAMAVGPSDKLLATGSADAIVRIWNLKQGSLLAEFGTDSIVTALAFTPDGDCIVAGDDVGRVQMLRIHGTKV